MTLFISPSRDEYSKFKFKEDYFKYKDEYIKYTKDDEYLKETSSYIEGGGGGGGGGQSTVLPGSQTSFQRAKVVCGRFHRNWSHPSPYRHLKQNKTKQNKTNQNEYNK